MKTTVGVTGGRLIKVGHADPQRQQMLVEVTGVGCRRWPSGVPVTDDTGYRLTLEDLNEQGWVVEHIVQSASGTEWPVVVLGRERAREMEQVITFTPVWTRDADGIDTLEKHVREMYALGWRIRQIEATSVWAPARWADGALILWERWMQAHDRRGEGDDDDNDDDKAGP